jgi:hypothetical protein
MDDQVDQSSLNSSEELASLKESEHAETLEIIQGSPPFNPPHDLKSTADVSDADEERQPDASVEVENTAPDLIQQVPLHPLEVADSDIAPESVAEVEPVAAGDVVDVTDEDSVGSEADPDDKLGESTEDAISPTIVPADGGALVDANETLTPFAKKTRTGVRKNVV